MTQKELYNQSLLDLLRVVIVLHEILQNKELTEEENDRIKYGTKVIKNVTQTQKKINKL